MVRGRCGEMQGGVVRGGVVRWKGQREVWRGEVNGTVVSRREVEGGVVRGRNWTEMKRYVMRKRVWMKWST